MYSAPALFPPRGEQPLRETAVRAPVPGRARRSSTPTPSR